MKFTDRSFSKITGTVLMGSSVVFSVLFVGMLYLTVFASQQKVEAIACNYTGGPARSLSSWCTVTGYHYAPYNVSSMDMINSCVSICRNCPSNQIPCTRTPCESRGGTCVGASSRGVGKCPAGKTYNTSISCNSFYRVCCAPKPVNRTSRYYRYYRFL